MGTSSGQCMESFLNDLVVVDTLLPSCHDKVFYMCVCVSRFSHVRLFATLWTVAHQAPLSMGFFRQEYWSGLPCLPPGDLPDLGIKLMPLMSPALAGGFFTTCTTWEAQGVPYSSLIFPGWDLESDYSLGASWYPLLHS